MTELEARTTPVTSQRWRSAVAILLLFAGFALQTVALTMLLEHASGWGWIGILAAHVAAAGLGAEGLAMKRAADSGGEDPPVGMLQAGWLIGLVFPLFGPAAVLILGVSLPMRTVRAHPLESPQSIRSRAASAALERKRGEQQLDTSLDAIVDALKDRDPKVRVAAIDALSGESSKRSARLLAEARQNTIFDVRVRAVQALGRMAKTQSDRLTASRKALALDPRSPALHREVARICFDYAQLGIEDTRMSQLLSLQARTHAQAALDLGDTDRETSIILARASNELGFHEEAERAYRRLLLRDDRDTDALIGVAESQFARRAFGQLPLTCRWVLHQAGKNLDQAAIDALKFWVRGEAVESGRTISTRRSMTRT